MKFVIAPDSFKDSLSATQVCKAISNGIKSVFPEAKIVEVPMADGGEGTTNALVDAMNGKYLTKNVSGPLDEIVSAQYGILDKGKTAIIEIAQACGINYIPTNKRTPEIIKKASTFGVGELISDALDHGVKKIILGLGGSSTNDAGSGMAQALGVRFYNKDNQLLKQHLAGGTLSEIYHFDLSKIDKRINNTEFIIASDVTNPLLGKNGATYTFSKQKGADYATQQLLEANLTYYAQLIENRLDQNLSTLVGTGAAGGLGFGIRWLTNAKIYPGVEVVATETKLEEKIRNANFVFTGEGATDFQTKFGKTPAGVARIAKKYNIPVFSLAGSIGSGIDQLYDEGFTAILGVLDRPSSLSQALEDGEKNITRTSESIAHIIKRLS